jgi:hypothetical protein
MFMLQAAKRVMLCEYFAETPRRRVICFSKAAWYIAKLKYFVKHFLEAQLVTQDGCAIS